MIFTDNLNLPIHKEKQNKSNSNNKVKQQVFLIIKNLIFIIEINKVQF